MKMSQSWILVVLLVFTICCDYSEQNELLKTDCLGSRGDNKEDVETCIKTILDKDKEMLKSLSEYFMRNTLYQMMMEELKTETRALTLSIQECKTETKSLASMMQENKQEMKALSSMMQENKQKTKALTLMMKKSKHESKVRSIHLLQQFHKSIKALKREIFNQTNELSNGQTKTLEDIQSIKSEMLNQTKKHSNGQKKILEDIQSIKSVIMNETSHYMEIQKKTAENMQSLQSDVVAISKNLQLQTESMKNKSEHLKTIMKNDIYPVILKIQETKQDTNPDYQRVVEAFQKSITKVEELKEGTISNFTKVMVATEKLLSSLEEIKRDVKLQFSRLFSLPDIVKQERRFKYTDEMRKSVQNKTYGSYDLPAILCDAVGLFTIDWNKFISNEWKSRWRRILGGESTEVYSYALMPENGIIVYLDLERSGSDLLLQSYYTHNVISPNRPSSISIYFQMKLFLELNNGESTIITRHYQRAQITDSEQNIVTMSSIEWNNLNPSKLPILHFQLL